MGVPTMAYQSVIRETVRFSTQAAAWSFIDLLVPLRSMRVADYGVDPEGAEPYWIAVDQLSGWEAYTPAQLERWTACGRTDL